MNKRRRLRDLWRLGVMTLLCAHPVDAARVLATPFAELTPAGEYRLWAFAAKEERANGDYRFLYRLDAGLGSRFEFGALVVKPQHARQSTWLNLQGLLVKEHDAWPTVSAGLWDAANLGRLGDRKTGGSLFLAVSRTVRLGQPGQGKVGPLKLNFGLGTNRLNGAFGGIVLALPGRAGLQVEYAPRNLRLPGADAWDVAIYHFIIPRLRIRASWMGGNPMLDLYLSGRVRGGL